MNIFNVMKVCVKDNGLSCKYEVFDEKRNEDYIAQFQTKQLIHPDLSTAMQSLAVFVADLMPSLKKMKDRIRIQGFYIVPSGTKRMVFIYAKVAPDFTDDELIDITVHVLVGGNSDDEAYPQEDLLLDAIDRCADEALKFINEGKKFDSEKPIVLDFDKISNR